MSALPSLEHVGCVWAMGFCLLGAATAPCGDPPAVEWEKTYGDDGGQYALEGWPNALLQTSDGGYVVAGHDTQDDGKEFNVYLVKIAPSGNEEWSLRIDGREPAAIHEKAEGGLVILHQKLVPLFDQSLWTTAVLTETDPTGKVVRSTTFTPHGSHGRCMKPTRDSGYIISGFRWKDAEGNTEAIAMRIDSAMNVMWSRVLPGCGVFVDVTDDGGFIFSGGCLLKTDDQGNEEWSKSVPGGASPAIQTSDGGYVMVLNPMTGPRSEWWSKLLKTDRDGNEEWSKDLSAREWFDARETCDGGYIVVSGIVDPAYLIRTDTQGNELWHWQSTRFPAGGAMPTRDGGYVITETEGLGGDIHVVKLAPDSDCRSGESPFRRGDSDSGGALNLTDAVLTLSYLFQAGPAPGCQDAADADDNGAIQITDAIFTLNHLFLGGPAPSEPFTSCGSDGTPDGLGCMAFPACP
jgi:hypothetical protein